MKIHTFHPRIKYQSCMSKVYLQKYSIQIKHRKSDKLQQVNVFNGTDDLFDVLKKFMKIRVLEPFTFDSQGYKKSFRVVNGIHCDDKQRVLIGYIKGGLNGDPTEFVKDSSALKEAGEEITEISDDKLQQLLEKHEDEEPEFRSGTNHTAYQSHLYYFWVPKGGTKAYVFFHKRPNNGVKVRFQRALQNYFSTMGYGSMYQLSIGSEFERKTFIEFLKKWPLTQISLSKNYRDLKGLDKIVDLPEDKIPEEHHSSQRVTISIKGADIYRYKLIAEDWLTKSKKLNSITVFDGAEDEEITLTVKVGDKPRSFSVVKGASLPEEDITDKIGKSNADGQPNIEKFIDIVEERISENGRSDTPRVKLSSQEKLQLYRSNAQ